MNNTTNNPKAKKNRIFKLKHLAIIVLILLLAIALRNNTYVLKVIHLIKPSTTQTITQPSKNNVSTNSATQYAPTPSTTSNVNNNNIDSNSNNDNDNDITNSTVTALNTNTMADIEALNQLQSQIVKQLAQTLQASSSGNPTVVEKPVVDKSTAIIVNALHQLIQQIQTQQSFANQLDIIQNLKINKSTASIIASLQPYKNYKFNQNNTLQSTYNALNKQIYLQYLKQQSGALALIKYFALNLVYVANSNYAKYSKTDIRYTLSYINFLINNNNLTLASSQLQQLITTYNITLPNANQFLQNINTKIALQQAVKDIKQDITNYLK